MSDQNCILQSTMETISSLPNELRLEGKFCDAVLKVENVECQVHKVVMCACDPFFINLFLETSDMESTDFPIEGVSHEIMSQIIDFAYTGSVSLTNIFELMITANQLNMTRLGETYSNILKDQLCPENCIGVWHFTKTNHFPKLQLEAFDFICGHFEEVALCGGFLQLTVQDLSYILRRDDLNVFPESRVYESVMKWINHRREERQGSIATLLSKVRLGLIDVDYVRQKVSNNDLVKKHRESNLMVLQVTGFHSRINNPLFRPRLPNAVLLAVGGFSFKNRNSLIEAYDYCTNSWIRLPMCNTIPVLSFHGTVFLGGSVYIVGGWLTTMLSVSNITYRLNTYSHTWEEVCPMLRHRAYASVTVLNGCIYAIGGFNGSATFKTAECYQPNMNQWMFIASMNDSRSNAGCTTLNNKIYICGGYNEMGVLKTAECYNLDTDQWTRITPMGKYRSGQGVIAYVDRIFAVGGADGFRSSKSVQAYNPVTNTWHNIPDMIEDHSYIGIAVINKRLFVVGDNTVESYDASTNSWSMVCSMEVSRYGLSCCVISGLSNMAEYCPPRGSIPVNPTEEVCRSSAALPTYCT